MATILILMEININKGEIIKLSLTFVYFFEKQDINDIKTKSLNNSFFLVLKTKYLNN